MTNADSQHDHGHHSHCGHHVHSHGPAAAASSSFTLALLLTLSFALVEALGGWWSGSLALISDAGHMLSDGFSLGLALFAARLAKLPPSARHSYGLVRAEVIAASVNSVLMLVVIVWIAVEAVQRLLNPQPVAGGMVMAIAAAGLAVNLLVAYVLSRSEQTLNTRAALLHVLGDALGSVAALVAGAVIVYTGWTPADPILSIFVAGLILLSSIRLLREALHVLMEGVPRGIELSRVGMDMARIAGVTSVHDLHIWTLSSGSTALSAHVELASMESWPRVLESSRQMLSRNYRIDHVTLQPEVMLPLRQPYKADIRIHPSE